MKKLLSYLTLISASTLAFAASPLDPQVAFKPVATAYTTDKGQVIEVRYAVAKGYYLYKERFKFTLAPSGAELKPAEFPKGEMIDDPNFGKSEVFKNDFVVTIPVAVTQNSPYRLTIAAQGCAAEGFCYPVFKTGQNVEFPGVKKPAEATAQTQKKK